MNPAALSQTPVTDPVYLTAWLAAILFFASRSQLTQWFPAWPRWQRRLDLLGMATLWIHIIVAYGLAHHWSHQAATDHVADRTQEMIGLRSGLGIYANFVAAFTWTILTLPPFQRPLPSTQLPEKEARRSDFRLKCESLRKKGQQAWRIVAEAFLWLIFVCAAIVFAHTVSAIIFSLIALTSLMTRLLQHALGAGHIRCP